MEQPRTPTIPGAFAQVVHFAAVRSQHLDKVEVDRLSVLTHAGVGPATPV